MSKAEAGAWTRLVDVGAAVAVVGFFWVLPSAGAPWPRGAAGVVLAGLATAMMLVARRMPAVATGCAAAATVLGSALGVCSDPMLAAAWCLYPLAMRRGVRTRPVVAALVVVATVLALVTAVPGEALAGMGERVLVAVVALGGSWLLGSAVGRQIVSAQAAERARVQLSVARDVHDTVGHALGVISAQAGVALAIPGVDEDELRATLGEVEGHARAALTEVQGLVRTLRTVEEGTAPGPARLQSLVTATRAAGVQVEARLEVSERICGATSAVLFRIVQESLGNVVRHAPGSVCSVDVREEGRDAVVRVRNHAARLPVSGPPGLRLGLTGMRERAALIGGQVHWTPLPDGGFEVAARLPLGRTP